MLRVNSNCMSIINEKCFYRGELFSGISFGVFGCKVVDAKEYENGILIGKYVNEFFKDLEVGEHICSDCLESEDEGYDEPVVYNGRRFTGIAYDFDGEVCSGELYYKNGWLGSDVTYYLSGSIEDLELIGKDFSQKYSWYEDGKVRSYEVFQRDVLGIRLDFDQAGRIVVLSIDGRYFDGIDEVKHFIKFPMFLKKDFLNNIFGGARLNIYGCSVDCDVFSSLVCNNGLASTLELRISGTSLSDEIFERMDELINLRSLIVESSYISKEKIEIFKFNNPGCYVEFNGSVVEF